MPSLLRTESLQPLRHKEFRIFIVARFFLIMALRMLGTVAAYKLFQLTKDSFSIGMAGLSEFVPVFALTCDRSIRQTNTTVEGCQLLCAVCSCHDIYYVCLV